MTERVFRRQDYIIDGVDYIEKSGDVISAPNGYSCLGEDDVANIYAILNWCPEFLADSPDAIHLRKILRRKAAKIDLDEWWKWQRKNNIQITMNTISAGSWLDILSSISNYLERYDKYVLKNKEWLLADSKTKNQAINTVIKKTKALRYALNNASLPDIPCIYEFMSCGQLMFLSKHHSKLEDFCRKNGAKALYDETFQDVLDNFEKYLKQKKIEHKGTSSKGVRHDRDLAKYLLQMLHTDLFMLREKAKPITLIMLIINIRYKKNYTFEKIKEWLSD